MRKVCTRPRDRGGVADSVNWERPPIFPIVLPLTEKVLSLVAAYEARGILPAKYATDMRHIALATIAEVDSLVSWKFKHVVRLEKIRLFK
jgi:hypothetical protein